MDNKCLEVLQKLDECLKDPDFQIIVIMKFMRNLTPILNSLINEGEGSERRR